MKNIEKNKFYEIVGKTTIGLILLTFIIPKLVKHIFGIIIYGSDNSILAPTGILFSMLLFILFKRRTYSNSD